MINTSLARRYAQALLDLAEADADRVADRLEDFDGLVTANPLLREVLISPAFRLEERRRVLDRLMEKLAWGPLLQRFLWYLVEHRRMDLLGGIAAVFRSMLDQRDGRVRIGVTTARALKEQERERLRQAIAAALDRTVIMEPRVDVQLIGGISVRVGDLLVDGSLKTQLETLRGVLARSA